MPTYHNFSIQIFIAKGKTVLFWFTPFAERHNYMNCFKLLIEYEGVKILVKCNDLEIYQIILRLYDDFIIKDKEKSFNSSNTISVESDENCITIANGIEVIKHSEWIRIFNKAFQDLIMLNLRKKYIFFHGSGVHYKNTNIIFIGKSGAGKTSCATYLALNKNARLIGDDFLPFRIFDYRLCAFPGSLHIKRDSIKLYKLIDKLSFGVSVDCKDSIYYFNPVDLGITKHIVCNDEKNIFIFPFYNNISNKCVKLDGLEKLYSFIDCVYNVDLMAFELINYIKTVNKVFRIEYTDFKEMELALEKCI